MHILKCHKPDKIRLSDLSRFMSVKDKEDVKLIDNFENKLFIIAGMPRSGTTFLYHNIQKHPKIFLPYRKEINYFTFNYYKGPEWYKKFYIEMKNEQTAGDISPLYFLDSKSISRIKEFSNNIKIIIIVRDPVEFALSLYSQFQTITWNLCNFSEFIKYYKINRGSTLEFSFKDRKFSDIIEDYRQTFKENLLLINFELIKENPLMVLKAIEGFTGTVSYFKEDNFDNVVINSGNRRNNKVITMLLRNETFIYLLNKLLPRKIVQFFRGQFDRLSSKNTALPYKEIPKEMIRTAEDLFGSQRDNIRQIFIKSPVVNGLLEPFSI